MGQKKRRKRKKGNQKGRFLAPMLAILLFITGSGVFFYPTVSNYFAERQQMAVIREYQAQMEPNGAEDLEAEWEKAEVYNENLSGDPVKDPFVPGSGYALPQNYEEVLNVGGIMGYVEIPKIDVMLPIYHGSSEEVLEKGVGHIESTALPIGGLYRHSVLTGHRGLPSAELFTRLDELEIGDIFLIHVLDQTLAYEVDQIKTVLPTELEDIQAIPERDLVTLLTCTPYGVNTHRLLVRGSRTEYVPQEEDTAEAVEDKTNGLTWKLSGVGIILGLCLMIFLIIFLWVKKNRRHYEK